MRVILSLLVAMLGMSALAEEATVTLQLPVSGYSFSKTDETEEVTARIAAKENAWLSIGKDDTLMYFYPFSSIPMVSMGKILDGKYELGLDLGTDALVQSETVIRSTDIYGVYAGVFPPTGSETFLEIYLVADRFVSKGEAETPTGTFVKASVDHTYVLDKKLSLTYGVSFSSFSQERTSTRTFEVNLLSMRLSI